MKSILLHALTLLLLLNSVAAQDWVNVGTSGITAGLTANSLIEFNGNLIMCGDFDTMESTPTANIAFWNGSDWAQVGDGINGDVRCMAILNNELYIGGNISSNATGSNDLPSVCKLVNGIWVGESDENVVGVVDDMMIWNNELYVVSNDWSLPHKLMKYNGTTWSQVGPSIGAFNDLQRLEVVEVFNDTLYIGGRIADVGPENANRVAKFDGTNWRSVGFPMLGEVSGTVSGWVMDLEVHDGKLFAGGGFYGYQGVSVSTAPSLASYDGAEWTAYSFDANEGAEILSLLSHDDILYCGGDFGTWEEGEISVGVSIFSDACLLP